MARNNGPGNIYKVRRGACYVCSFLDDHEEMLGTDMVYVGGGLMRHKDCAPGSRKWAEKFPDSYLGRWYQETINRKGDV